MTGPATISRYRFSRPTTEDLPRLARLAFEAASVHCGACRHYHVTAPWFRALGIGGIGVEFSWESQFDTILRAIGGRTSVRWLAAGAADAGVPALIGRIAAARPGTDHTVTVVDRCETPLTLCRAHAEAEGSAIETIRGDLRDFRRDEAFDIVLMHFTTIFFAADEVVPFLRHAGTWLAPGGLLIAGLHHDRPSEEPARAPLPLVNEWRSAIVREAVAAGEIDLPEDVEDFIGRIDRRGLLRSPRRSSTGDAAELVRAAGLLPRELALLPFADAEAAIWGGDCRQRCLVVAARP
ncbi:MAG: class I SAM-dependent methyltransferase [Bauldia sp.]